MGFFDDFRITSPFGPRDAPKTSTGYGSSNHPGIDFAMPTGTPVLAQFGGVVDTSRSTGGYGNMVTVAGGYGTDELLSKYAHLSSFASGLNAGDVVNPGDLLGYSGQSGNASGPHLHFETDLNGKAVDPNSISIERSWLGDVIYKATLGARWVIGDEAGAVDLFNQQNPGSNLKAEDVADLSIWDEWSGKYLGRLAFIVVGLVLLAGGVWMLAGAGNKTAIVIQKTAKGVIA